MTTAFGSPAIGLATLADLVRSRGELTRAAQLLGQDDLLPDLAGRGPFTIFAPTNEAFARLSVAEKAMLVSDPDLRIDVLEFHVVVGLVRNVDASVRTVQGERVTVAPRGDTVTIAGHAATLVATGVNGALYRVPHVLSPAWGSERGLPRSVRWARFTRF